MKNLPSIKNVSLETINSFVAWFLSQPRDDSFMCFKFMNDCEEIQKIGDFYEKRKKVTKMVNHLSEIETRKEYYGNEVDFRNWKLGSIALPSSVSDRISKCPICGKNGVVIPPYPESGFEGETLHVIIPFAMGSENKVVCYHKRT